MGGLSESVRKENLWWKSFIHITLNEVLTICEKWYLDVKINKNNKKKRSGGSILQIFIRHIPTKIEI